MSSTDDLDSSYQPPAHYRKPIRDQSSIATILRQQSRRGERPKPLIKTEENLSSEDATSECSEDSSAPVYMKDHSLFPGLKPTLAPPKEVAPKRTSPYFPNTWFSAQCSKPTEVYIDEACVHNRKGESEGGVGVWFGSNHPWNISRPAQERKTNNSAEIQAATPAAKKATENGVAELLILKDSKFLIDSCKKWIHTWTINGWKTADGKPVVNKTEFEELLKALAPFEVVWNHVPGHPEIKGNEGADQLARAAIKKDEPEVMTPLEDGTFHKNSVDEPKGTTETMINISPNCTSSEDSDSPDEEPDEPEAVSATQNETTGMLNAHARRREV